MSDTTETPTLDPVVRFRVRTLLGVTTALAILAAIAGPYYRTASSDAQPRLLTLWFTILLAGIASFWLRLRDHLRRDPALNVRFVVYYRKDGSPRAGIIVKAIFCFGVFIWTAVVSISITEAQGTVLFGLREGFVIGVVVSGAIFGLIRQPMALCDEGIPMGKGRTIPWKYIRYAVWMPESPDVLKLRRYDGDLYVEVPASIRDEVEAFVGARTEIRSVDYGL
jgi:hypothetical protein